MEIICSEQDKEEYKLENDIKLPTAGWLQAEYPVVRNNSREENLCDNLRSNIQESLTRNIIALCSTQIA